jgi:hypothetical protein
MSGKGPIADLVELSATAAKLTIDAALLRAPNVLLSIP